MIRTVIETPSLFDLNRLDVPHSAGFIDASDFSFSVYVAPGCQTSSAVDEDCPARNSITPNLSGGESISVLLHETIPDYARSSVLAHELYECWLLYELGTDRSWGHRIAVHLEQLYAEKNLSYTELEAYKSWASTIRKLEREQLNPPVP